MATLDSDVCPNLAAHWTHLCEGLGGGMPSQLVAQGLSLVPHDTQVFHQQRDDEKDAARRLQERNN